MDCSDSAWTLLGFPAVQAVCAESVQTTRGTVKYCTMPFLTSLYAHQQMHCHLLPFLVTSNTFPLVHVPPNAPLSSFTANNNDQKQQSSVKAQCLHISDRIWCE